jgi:hypothetical protein
MHLYCQTFDIEQGAQVMHGRDPVCVVAEKSPRCLDQLSYCTICVTVITIE